MFRLLKLGLAMMGLAAFAWFGITHKLGSRTLFQHLRAIGQTKESQELVEGTRQAAGPLVDDVRRKISGKGDPAEDSPSSAPAGEGGRPQERLSSSEQRQLRKLLGNVER